MVSSQPTNTKICDQPRMGMIEFYVGFVGLLLLGIPSDLKLRAQENKVKESFALISVIKSVAGEKPSSEFFDLNFKFRIYGNIFSLAGADLALSGADTAGGEKLTEAGVSLNYGVRGGERESPTRRIFWGIVSKIFNTVPYAGLHAGTIEVSGKLVSSYLTFAFLRRVTEVEFESTEIPEPRQFKDNFYFEFALHSQEIEFLRYLRIKGGILLPAWWNSTGASTNRDIQTRIALEVPIGKIIEFD